MKTPQRQLARARRAGFSLAELMVVIVIIGLLATIVVPNVVAKLFTSQRGKAKADIMVIVQAVDNFVVENNGRYPDGLEALVQVDEDGNSYLKQQTVPLDPWKNEYQYEPPGPGQNQARVYTLGADGQSGGTGKDADLDNIMIQNGEAD